jgi:hypothetical protein
MCIQANFIFPSNFVAFSTKKTAEILEFYFFGDANSTIFLFLGKLICQILYCKNIEKETLLQGESKPMSTYISSY